MEQLVVQLVYFRYQYILYVPSYLKPINENCEVGYL